MSYEIHITISEDSRRGHVIASLAAEQHLTPSQAVEKLIDQVAEMHVVPAPVEKKARIAGLPREPLSAEDVATVDEAMALVMAARRERSERLFGA